MKKPFISIIIPVYNARDFLRECLDSALAQEFRDIEILCVNDGSTDDSAQILEEYRERDDRIIVISKTNGGVGSARNAGLDKARGRYIMFLDNDDTLDVRATQEVYDEAARSRAGIIVFQGKTFPTDKVLDDLMTVKTGEVRVITTHAFFYDKGSRPFVWNKAFKRSLINRHHIRFDEGMRLFDDQLFCLYTFPRAMKAAYIEKTLYNYRRHSASELEFLENHIDEKMSWHWDGVQRAYKFIKKQPCFFIYKKAFGNWVLWHMDRLPECTEKTQADIYPALAELVEKLVVPEAFDAHEKEVYETVISKAKEYGK